MPVLFDAQFLNWMEREAPATFGRLTLLFEVESHLERLVQVCLNFRDEGDLDMSLYHENLRLIDVCQSQQLEIHRVMLPSYHRDVMIFHGLCQNYNGHTG